jgi:2-desacetyl-2-hydroxyethyl bacteriochlorophyllide A dehydrogenase
MTQVEYSTPARDETATMKALVCVKPGQLEIETRARPMRKAGEALVRVRRVGVCGTDMHIYSGRQPYLEYPRVMGHELSGEVAEADPESQLRVGDVVYIMPYLACGHCHACKIGKTNCCMKIQVLGVHRDGGMAEYISVPEAFVFRCNGLDLDSAAMIEFLAIGRHAVRRSGLLEGGAGKRVLVVGVGPIGIATSLFAKLSSAHVTVVDSRPARLAFCRDHIGVDDALIVDDALEANLAAATQGDFYDVVFDATGAPAAMEKGFHYVAHGGSYILISVVSASLTFSDPEFHKRETTLMGSRNATIDDFEAVVEAMRNGKVPVRALNTHRAALKDMPEKMPDWARPDAGVIKALVEC